MITGNQTMLKEGMTFTIEPGIYIPGVAGVRIEDNILVQPNSHLVLTAFPKRLITIQS